MRTTRWLGGGLILLGLAVATCALLGPLVTDVIRYRTSHTTLNQISGGDAAALFVVAPVSIAVGLLALRGHRAAPVLALAPSIFAGYTYAQLAVGNEYLRLPGNTERWFPLLLGVFVLAGALAVGAWGAVDVADLPPMSRRTRRFAGGVLLFITAFLVLGLHLGSYVDAVRDHPTRVEYVSSPTAFFLVKFMDVGIVAPACLAVGIGLLRGRGWAPAPMYALVGGFTLLGASVSAMGITMVARDDPDGSLATVAGALVVTGLLVALTAHLYRPLLRRG